MDSIQTSRAKLVAGRNRLNSAVSTIQIVTENMVAVGSELIDLDMAREISNLIAKEVLAKAATGMLDKANRQAEHVMRLLSSGRILL